MQDDERNDKSQQDQGNTSKPTSKGTREADHLSPSVNDHDADHSVADLDNLKRFSSARGERCSVNGSLRRLETGDFPLTYDTAGD